jgi:hypothetical protein
MFADKRRSLGRYSSLADEGPGVSYSVDTLCFQHLLVRWILCRVLWRIAAVLRVRSVFCITWHCIISMNGEWLLSVSSNAVHCILLGRPYTNCIETSIKTWDKKDKSWRQHHDSDSCAAVFIISLVSTVLLSLRHVADIVSWLLHVLTHAGVRPTLEITILTVPGDASMWLRSVLWTLSGVNT